MRAPIRSRPAAGRVAGASYGLPLIALLPSAPKAGLSAQVVDRGRQRAQHRQRAALRGRRADLSQLGPGVRHDRQEILQDDHAVLLIARHPYAAGSYDGHDQPARARRHRLVVHSRSLTRAQSGNRSRVARLTRAPTLAPTPIAGPSDTSMQWNRPRSRPMPVEFEPPPAERPSRRGAARRRASCWPRRAACAAAGSRSAPPSASRWSPAASRSGWPRRRPRPRPRRRSRRRPRRRPRSASRAPQAASDRARTGRGRVQAGPADPVRHGQDGRRAPRSRSPTSRASPARS